jgi:hypothetical protein
MSQQINLFNPAFRRQERHFSAATLLQALGALALALAAIFSLQAYQNRGLEQVLGNTDRQLTARRDQLLDLSRQLASRGADQSAATQLAAVEERLALRRALLGEVRTGAGGNAGGFSSYLAALARRTMPGVWLTGIELGKSNELVLKGRVLQSDLVPAYIKRLNQEEPFAGRAVRELRLVARDEAPPQPGQPQQAAAPRAFVEFFMSLPL